MLSLFRSQAKYIPRVNRFFSDRNQGALWSLCEKPRIKAAMQKENITISMLANVDLFCLSQFERENVHTIYQNGLMSFSDYALAPMDKQNKILWFLGAFKYANDALSQKYIRLDHLSYLSYANFDLFNPKFCQYMLDTQKITIANYIAENKMNELYGLSSLFDIQNIDDLLKNDPLFIDKILKLDYEQLSDLAELLSGGVSRFRWSQKSFDIRCWIEQNYLTLERFLQCDPGDRRTYLCFMYNKKVPCDNFTLDYYLSLEPSTRQYISFHHHYLSPVEFDRLTPELQKSLCDILFTNMGLYALGRNHITVKQFCKLPVNAQSALAVIFYEADYDRGGDIYAKREVDGVFLHGFDFEQFSAIADKSKEEAISYLRHDKNSQNKGPGF